MAKRVQPVVQTVGLCKTFRDFWRRPRVEAVKDLNLEIRPGEVFGLLGPNGSGKTTTIKMLLGLHYPTRGRIAIFGQPPTDVAVKARLGLLPEESYLYRFLDAYETLDYFGRLFKLPARVRRERSEHLLDMVGLRHEAKRQMGEYSKGMARRIGLAQALINDPEFLILDEPTSGLDPIGARQIKDVIRSLGDKGKTILLSSHQLSDVEDVCDRVSILYGGQQQAAGDIGELLRKQDVTQITVPALREEVIEEVAALIHKLEQKDIIEVSHPRVKLEEFFLKIVRDAQAKNVKTSGAKAGGEVPDFLQKPTEVGEDLVGSLITAAEKEWAASEPQAPAEPIKEEPEHGVLADLMAPEPEAPEPEAPLGPDVSTASSTEKPAPDRGAVAGDQSVIDGLLGGDAPPADESSENNA